MVCIALVLGTGIAGCAIGPSPTSTVQPGVSVDADGVATLPLTPDFLCADVFLRGQLHGDPQQRPPVWLTAEGSTTQSWLVWPKGTRVVFQPTLAVIARDGTVVAREGDHVEGGACVIGEGTYHVVVTDLNGHSLR